MGSETSSTTNHGDDYTSRHEKYPWKSYDQQYSHQTAEKDDYGTPVYDRYQQSYAYEPASGHDAYGNPTYD
jgi:hypothetical protein